MTDLLDRLKTALADRYAIDRVLRDLAGENVDDGSIGRDEDETHRRGAHSRAGRVTQSATACWRP